MVFKNPHLGLGPNPLRGTPALARQCFDEAHIAESLELRGRDRLWVCFAEDVWAIPPPDLAADELEVRCLSTRRGRTQTKVALPLA